MNSGNGICPVGSVPAMAAARVQTVKRVSVLGSTGSIGESTLDLVGRTPEAFEIVALTARSNVEKLAAQAIAHRAKFVVIGDKECYPALRERLAGTGIEVAAGPDALVAAAELTADCVLAAI